MNDRLENHWHTIINECKNSNISIVQFCKNKKITEPTFYYWKKKLGIPNFGTKSSSATLISNSASSQVLNSPACLSENKNKKKISKSNFISISDQDKKQEEELIAFKFGAYKVYFSKMPAPSWVAEFIKEVQNELPLS